MRPEFVRCGRTSEDLSNPIEIVGESIQLVKMMDELQSFGGYTPCHATNGVIALTSKTSVMYTIIKSLDTNVN